ncbi:MAG: hypothetical protein DM484_08760 [Candidatus Methylumidiphilus alinenensis]|uniref:DUF4231 domain-containing protein n=1 Tax=Candidatus Methylumidiphilus alinenensis TaxID=2202197 RepID=A0A2W4RAR5_9GAMM|nr:MAG: hypothetical protein DM484_08760 [Candidatus Methylumidiphilus alinenensis]
MNSQNDLDLYYDALFKEGNKHNINKNIFSIFTVIFLLFAVFANGYFLYSSSLLAIFCQLISWYWSYRAKNSYMLAHDLQKIAMLEKAYGEVPSVFDLSHQKANISLWVSKLVKNNINKQDNPIKYSIKDETSSESKLISMLQENSYFNHHLYEKCFIRYRAFLLIFFSLVLIIPLFMIPVLANDPNYSLPRLAFVVLSWSIIFESMETTLNYRFAAKVMLELDNQFSRIKKDNNPAMLDLFSKYDMAKRMCPPISERIYKKYRDILNEGWNRRNLKLP